MNYKVFHIVTHFDIGGSETVALNIAKAKKENIEFHLVEVVRGKGKYTDAFIKDLNEHHIKYHRSPVSTNFILGALLFPFWFCFLYFKYKPNVFHSHTESPDVALFLFYTLFGAFIPKTTKVVRTLHNTKLWKRKHFIGCIIEHFFLRHQSNVAISEPVRNSYLSDFPFYNKQIPIIYNGLEEKQQIPFEGLKQEKINILFAGRMVEQKGVDVLSKVVIKLNERNNNFYFYIVGNGPLKKQLHDELKNYDNVKFYENVYNLASYLGSFDFLFMPSRYEGLSMLSIEASFAHLPVIINSCNGLEDTLPKTWPLKVKHNEVNHYVQIFEKVKSINRIELSDSSYKYVKDRFGIKVMQDKYLSVYSA